MARVDSLTTAGINALIDQKVAAAIAAIPPPTGGTGFDQTAAINLLAARRVEMEIVETSPGVYPARYIYAGPVVWKGTIAPLATGTTTNGTNAVPGLDYFRHLS